MSEIVTRPCPACAEPILHAAKKCKHCGEWTTSEPLAEPETPMSAEALYQQAHDAHHKSEDADTAESLYLQVLGDFPESPEAGYAQTQLNNLRTDRPGLEANGIRRQKMEAEQRSKQLLVEKERLLKETYKQALDLHYKAKDADEAALLYRQVIEGQPDSQEAGYARTQLANIKKSASSAAEEEARTNSDAPSSRAVTDPSSETQSEAAVVAKADSILRDPKFMVLGVFVLIGLAVMTLSVLTPMPQEPTCASVAKHGLGLESKRLEPCEEFSGLLQHDLDCLAAAETLDRYEACLDIDEGIDSVFSDRKIITGLGNSAISELGCQAAVKNRIANDSLANYAGDQSCPELDELRLKKPGNEFGARDLEQARESARSKCYERIKTEAKPLSELMVARSDLTLGNYDFERKEFIFASHSVELIDGLLKLSDCATTVLTEGSKKGLSGRFDTTSSPQLGGLTVNHTRRYLDVALPFPESEAKELNNRDPGPYVLEIIFRPTVYGDTPLVHSVSGLMESKVKGQNGHAIAYRVVGKNVLIPWTAERQTTSW